MQSLGLRGHAPAALGARRVLPLRPTVRRARPQLGARPVVAQAAQNGNGAPQFAPVCVNQRGIVASAQIALPSPALAQPAHRTAPPCTPTLQQPRGGAPGPGFAAAAAASATRPALSPPLQVACGEQDVPFKKLMAANRGEIAVRITRAGIELGLTTVSAAEAAAAALGSMQGQRSACRWLPCCGLARRSTAVLIGGFFIC